MRVKPSKITFSMPQLNANSNLNHIVTIYAPASPWGDPKRLLNNLLKDMLRSRELAWRLFLRNLSARYRQTILGYLWAVLPPILTSLVFIYLHNAGYFSIGPTEAPYGVFLFTGVVLWQVFADAVNAPLRMVQQSIPLLAKVNFPREALIVAGLGEVLFGFVVRAVLLMVVLLWHGVSLSWIAVATVGGVLALAALGLAVGLLLTPIALLYHDIGQGLPFILYLWMLLTPVIYPAPDPATGTWTMLINPVGPLLDTTRIWLFSGLPPYLDLFIVACGLTGVALLAGLIFYRVALPILIERIPS